MEFIVIAMVCVFVLALLCKPIRKTIGLLMVIFGVLGIISFLFALPGVVAVIVGGILLFA